MDAKNKLKNNLIRKIQKLSSDKLFELSALIDKIEMDIKSKDKTLSLAGSWSNIDDEIFKDLTEDLHNSRLDDRQFS
jgi:hypothetical protein